MENYSNVSVRFFGTGINVKGGEKVKIGNKGYPNIRKYIKNDTLEYRFSGPNLLDLGPANISNNIKNGINLLSDYIDNRKSQNGNNKNNLIVTISGHSRGGVAATRVADKIRKKYSDDKKVKVILNSVDPYAGPTHSGKNISIDLKRNSNEETDDIIFYSMGASVPCSPQKILNAKTVLICEAGHVDILDFEKKFFNSKDQTIQKAKETGGLYLLTMDSGKKLIAEVITKNNLKETMDKIYNWKKSYSARTRLLTEVIVKKLNLHIDDVLTSGAVKEWDPASKKTLDNINHSLLLKTAFSYVFDLFSDKLFGPYIKKDGEFFNHLDEAKNAVVGIRNNNYSKALSELEKVITNSKQKYKKEIAKALKKRINNYYKIDGDE